MSIKYTNLYRIFFVLGDLFALNTVFLLLLLKLNSVSITGINYTILFLVSNMTWLASSYISSGYLIYKDVDLKKISKRTAYAFALFCTIVFFFIFIYRYNYSRLFVTLSIAGFGAFLFISRSILVSVVIFTRTSSRFQCKVVIIGKNEISRDLTNIFFSNHKTIRIQGYFDDHYTGLPDDGYPFLGRIKDCLYYAIENHISEIYCTLSPESLNELYSLAEEAEKNFIRFRFVPDLRNFIDRKVHVDFIENMPVLSLRAEPLSYKTAQIKKRIFDVVMSSLIIVFLLSWLLPLLAILIKLDSKGPVFFTQKRSGKNNQPFSCLKLRSLKAHDHADGATNQVTKDDERVTKVGRFLRKTNLDELPQFFNVLRGQMSIVGARPHMLRHTVDFATIETEYMLRHLTKPGVTGWAQINGYRGEIKQVNQLKKRIEHDIWYIENWNIWLDVKIVFLTVYVTLKGDKNAY